ncbi:MAG: hypothetical protein VYE00_09035 [Candidatus Poribacteria bacterium]|nr:hypothetical protein [Candidatus Poribacteria bacterium]
MTPANPLGSFDLKVVNPDTQEVVAKEAFVSVARRYTIIRILFVLLKEPLFAMLPVKR